ncbi:MAG: hypothetical protein HY812_14485 [Planctomycetes bacterium]|nr:hypothetical protein [Planctomycetota bacterium]
MSLREDVRGAVLRGDARELDSLVAAEPRALRFLLGLTYQTDESTRRNAARGIALAGRHHPRLVQGVVRRLVWAMNDESGTNAATAPAVINAIAGERPELLLGAVPDLIRLAADGALHDELVAALQTVVERCPGKVGRELQDALNRRIEEGGSHDL